MAGTPAPAASTLQILFSCLYATIEAVTVCCDSGRQGASVTSASLCDAILASSRASFLTPFARLGVPPEGCSSVHFSRVMGEQAADKMLAQGYKVGCG